MIEALYCGSRLQPGLEKGPAKEGPIVEMFRGKPYIMGHTTELIAQIYNISREEMDVVALRSHNNAERATKDGDFKEEIVPIEIPQKKGKPPVFYDKDEHFIPGLTMDKLAALPAAFIPKVGKVTAGNASGINDGAAAMIIMSAEKAKELGLKPIAKIKAVGYGGCHPSVMGLSPAPAVRALMSALGVQARRLPAHRAQRGLCRPVHRLREGARHQPGDHQRERLRLRPGPPGGGDGLPDHGDAHSRDEEAGQYARPRHPLRRRRRVHGDGPGDDLTGPPARRAGISGRTTTVNLHGPASGGRVVQQSIKKGGNL